jgi:hypothetical protein
MEQQISSEYYQPALSRKKNKNEFSGEYIESAFLIWYQNGREGPNDLVLNLTSFEHLGTPSPNTIRKWIRKFRWEERAELLDKKVMDALDRGAITSKLEMLNRHADLGRLAQEKATLLLFGDGATPGTINIRNARDAIRLLVEGVRMEQESMGVEKLLDTVSKMSDDQVKNKLTKLFTKAGGSMEHGNK